MNSAFDKTMPIKYTALWGLGCVLLWFAWTGFISSDDEYYAAAGYGWLHDFPYVGTSFGETRAIVAIPIAVCLGLFGDSESAVVLSSALFYLGVLTLSLHMLSRVLPSNVAFVGAALLATLPLLAIHATIPNADLPELFFVVASLYLFWMACQRESRFILLLTSGIAAGLAFSARETTLGLLLFYALLFVFGYGILRSQYWTMALGFTIVVGSECLYYHFMTGNAFYRFALFKQGASIRDRVDVSFMTFTPSGTLHIWEPIDPLIMFVTHQHYFSLLIFAAIPALIWALSKRPDRDSAARQLAFLVGLLGVTWFFFAAFALTNQKLLPRYYAVTACCFLLTTVIWAATALWPNYRNWVTGSVIAFVLVSLMGIYFSNRNPRFAERELVQHLARTTETIYTDPMTADKSRWYCQWAKLDCARINTRPPPPGSLYFYNALNTAQPNRLVDKERLLLYQPQPTWIEIGRQVETKGTNLLSGPLRVLTKVLPPTITQKIDRPPRAVRVYRVPLSHAT